MNGVPVLATPLTVTTMLPVVAPAGTAVTIAVELQFVAVAAVPLKLTVLLPCDVPKLAPMMVTGVPTAPADTLRLLMVGAELLTVNGNPLLATPLTVTTTLPVVAPVGTVTVMDVALQLVAVAAVPLKATVLLPCVVPKLVPVMVTDVPTVPADTLRPLMAGGGSVTVKVAPLLATPPIVTTTLPVVAPVGTAATIAVLLQLVTVAAVPLNVTLLVLCDVPKFAPIIPTVVPTTPELGVS